MKKLILTLAILLSCSSAKATTYYVRADGGVKGTTSTTCNGQYDVAYNASSPNGPNCALNHPFWLTGVAADCGNTSGVMEAGDTAIIYPKAGGYAMGLGSPNTSGSAWWPWECYMKSPPSGANSSNKTKIYGSNYANCSSISSATELYGVRRSYQVINLQGADNIDLRCLNITDHSDCRYNSSISDGDVCPNSYPYTGDFAKLGVKSSYSDNIYMKDIWVHGMSAEGFSVNNPSGWTLDNVNVWANGGINYNFNGSGASGTGDQATGTMTLTGGIIAFSGCTEKYPVTSSAYEGLTLYDPKMCCSQDQGCSADGLGTNSNSADWVIDGQVYIHNVADGLDLLYVDQTGGTVTIKNSAFIDNSGNQIKYSNNSIAYNNVVKGDCNFFSGKSYTWTGNGGFSDHCRAGGDAVVSTFQTDSDVKFYGNTIYDVKGNDAFSVNARGPASCTSGNELDIQNSIMQSPSNRSFINVDANCTNSTRTQINSNIYGFSSNPSGTGNNFNAPAFASGTVLGMTLSAYLSASSPARDLSNETAPGQPSTDLNGFSRGVAYDSGALEYGSTGQEGGAADCTAQTISNCDLVLTDSGSSDGTCDEGYLGACSYSCTDGVWSLSSNTCAIATCDDGTLDAGEDCDDLLIPDPLNGATCCSLGFSCDPTDALLSCAELTCQFNTANCTAIACQDGYEEGSEQCDDGNATEGDGCSSICETENANYQLFLANYAETDPNSHLTVTTHKVSIVGLTHNESAKVQRDFGAGYFQNYNINAHYTMSDCTSTLWEDCGIGVVSLTETSRADLAAQEAATDGIALTFAATSNFASKTWKLVIAGVLVDSAADTHPFIQRYIKMTVSGTVVTVKFYEDANYLTEITALELTGTYSGGYPRYLVIGSSYNSANANVNFSGSIENVIVSTDTPPDPPAQGCEGTTTDYCIIPALDNANSGGSCSTTGSCEYLCTEGVLSETSNTCTEPISDPGNGTSIDGGTLTGSLSFLDKEPMGATVFRRELSQCFKEAMNHSPCIVGHNSYPGEQFAFLRVKHLLEIVE